MPLQLGAHQNEPSKCNHSCMQRFKSTFAGSPVITIYKNVIDCTETLKWNQWDFFSVEDILAKYDANRQRNFVDIASTYGENGYIFVLAYIFAENTFFLRPDGGPNDHERLVMTRRYNNKHFKINSVYTGTKIINVQINYNILEELLNIDFMANAFDLIQQAE